MGYNNITNVGMISGSGGACSAGDIVSNSGLSADGNLAKMSGVSGKVIADAGIVAANVVTNAGTSTSGNLASLSGTTGKLITDSGVVDANVVTGPASSVLNRIAVFAGTTGKVLADSGATLAQYAALAGAAFTGALTGTTAAFSGAVSALRFVSTTPTCYMTYNTPITAVPYTANTAKLIDLGTFTELADPTSEFIHFDRGHGEGHVYRHDDAVLQVRHHLQH
jgi:hypothetical protein